MNIPQENRINGHKNITILEKTKIMSLNNNAPPFLWTKVINIGYVQLKCPTKEFLKTLPIVHNRIILLGQG